MPQQSIMLSELNCYHGKLETINYSLDLQDNLNSKIIMKHKMIQQWLKKKQLKWKVT